MTKRPVFLLNTEGKSKQQLKAEARAALAKFLGTDELREVMSYWVEPDGLPVVGQNDSFIEAVTALERLDQPGDITMGLSQDRPRILLARRSADGSWEHFIDESREAGNAG